jgi:hypothetical protein
LIKNISDVGTEGLQTPFSNIRTVACIEPLVYEKVHFRTFSFVLSLVLAPGFAKEFLAKLDCWLAKTVKGILLIH